MSALPSHARVVIVGAGIVGNGLALAPRPPRLARHRPGGQGPAPEPGRLHGPRIVVHVRRGPLAPDVHLVDRLDPRVRGAGHVHADRRARDRADPGADARAAPSHGAGEVLGHRDRAPDAIAGRRARAVHGHVQDPGRLQHAGRRRGGPAPCRHDLPRAGDRAGCAPELRKHGGHRARRQERADQRRHDDARAYRRRAGRRLRWGLEPPGRRDGGRHDPARAGRPPDGRHRPGAGVRGARQPARLSGRPRHGCQDVRAPERRRPGDRVVRAPGARRPAGGHPVQRAGIDVAHGAPIHRRSTSTRTWRRCSSSTPRSSATRRWASSTRSTA